MMNPNSVASLNDKIATANLDDDNLDNAAANDESEMSPEEALIIFKRVNNASGLDGLLRKNSGVTIEMMKTIAGHWGMTRNKDKKHWHL